MIIPGFDIIERIGEGDFASVWKAFQTSLDRTVALKILKVKESANADHVRDFVNEARAAAKLKHPNLIQVYDVAEQNGLYYFVMEYVSGASVARILDRDRKVPIKDALNIAKAIAEALNTAWKKLHIIHRDIKPENIILDEDGTVKLADLGLAWRVKPENMSQSLDTDMIEGTPNYMSPEQAEGKLVQDCRTDIYSLGATLYHMVTGRLPFAETDPLATLERHRTDQLAHPRDVDRTIPTSVCLLITKMMMKSPDERYANWSEVLRDIKQASSGRALVMNNPAPGASTIAPPMFTPQHATRMTGAHRMAIPTPGIPSWFRILAWMLILGWWIFFGYLMWPRASTSIPVNPDTGGGAGTPVATSPGTTDGAPELGADPLAGGHDGDTTTPDEVAPTVDVDQEAQELQLLTETVGSYLVENKLTSATKVLAQAGATPDRPEAFQAAIQEMTALIQEMVVLQKDLRTQLVNKIDKPITVLSKGKPVKVTLRGVAGSKMTVASAGGKTASLPISAIHPAQQATWLGAPKTPAARLLKCTLLMHAGEPAKATPYAPDSGPFADFMRQQLAANETAGDESAATPETP